MREQHQNATKIHLRLAIVCKGDGGGGNADRHWHWRVVVGIIVYILGGIFGRVVLVGCWPFSRVEVYGRVHRSLPVGLLDAVVSVIGHPTS